MSTDANVYLQGFALTSAILVIEHITLYAWLETRGDARDVWRNLARLVLGVLAILAGCAWIAWQTGVIAAVLAPAVVSMAGSVVALGYAGRWLLDRIKDAAYRRGRIHGLADHADIRAEDPDGWR